MKEISFEKNWEHQKKLVVLSYTFYNFLIINTFFFEEFITFLNQILELVVSSLSIKKGRESKTATASFFSKFFWGARYPKEMFTSGLRRC